MNQNKENKVNETIPRTERRDCKITIKLTRGEKEVLDAKAKLLGKKTSVYARSVILTDLNTDVNCSRAKKPEQYVNFVMAINNISDEQERKIVNKRMEEFVVCH